MLENVTLLHVSGSADGKTDFFLFAVASLSVQEEILSCTVFHSLSNLRLHLNCPLSVLDCFVLTLRLRPVPGLRWQLPHAC